MKTLMVTAVLLMLGGCSATNLMSLEELQAQAIVCDKELGVPEARVLQKACLDFIGMDKEKCKKAFPIPDNSSCYADVWNREEVIIRRDKRKAEQGCPVGMMAVCKGSSRNNMTCTCSLRY